MQEAKYHIRWIHNVDLRKLMDGHDIAHEEILLVTVNVLLTDPLISVRSGSKNVHSHSDARIFEDVLYSVAFY